MQWRWIYNYIVYAYITILLLQLKFIKKVVRGSRAYIQDKYYLIIIRRSKEYNNIYLFLYQLKCFYLPEVETYLQIAQTIYTYDKLLKKIYSVLLRKMKDLFSYSLLSLLITEEKRIT